MPLGEFLAAGEVLEQHFLEAIPLAFDGHLGGHQPPILFEGLVVLLLDVSLHLVHDDQPLLQGLSEVHKQHGEFPVFVLEQLSGAASGHIHPIMIVIIFHNVDDSPGGAARAGSLQRALSAG